MKKINPPEGKKKDVPVRKPHRAQAPKIRVWVTFYPNKFPRSIAGGKLGTVWLDEYMAERARGSDGIILTGIVCQSRIPKPKGRKP